MRCPYCNEPSMLNFEINLCVCAACKLNAPRDVFEALSKRLTDRDQLAAKVRELEDTERVQAAQLNTAWSVVQKLIATGAELAAASGRVREALAKLRADVDSQRIDWSAALATEIERLQRRVKELEERAERAVALLSGKA